MGRAQAIPSPQQDACTGPWGLVGVRKAQTEETTMVRRADLHNVRKIAEIRPSSGLLAAKNIHDHAAFNAS